MAETGVVGKKKREVACNSAGVRTDLRCGDGSYHVVVGTRRAVIVGCCIVWTKEACERAVL